jgi:hypothetical protein
MLFLNIEMKYNTFDGESLVFFIWKYGRLNTRGFRINLGSPSQWNSFSTYNSTFKVFELDYAYYAIYLNINFKCLFHIIQNSYKQLLRTYRQNFFIQIGINYSVIVNVTIWILVHYVRKDIYFLIFLENAETIAVSAGTRVYISLETKESACT